MRPDSSRVFNFVLRVASLLAFLGALAVGVDAHAQDIERGRQLYENHCRKCHGAEVHKRSHSPPMSVAELREIVSKWQADQGLRWRDEEIDDVVRYLARTRYLLQVQRTQ